MVVWRQPSVQVCSEAQASVVDAWSGAFKSPWEASDVSVLTGLQHTVSVSDFTAESWASGSDFPVSPSHSVGLRVSFMTPCTSILCPLSCAHSLPCGIKQVAHFPTSQNLRKIQAEMCLTWFSISLLFWKWSNYSSTAINCVNNSFCHRIAYINILSCVPLHSRLREMICWYLSETKHSHGFKKHQLKIWDDGQATAGPVRKKSLVLNGPDARMCLCVSITLCHKPFIPKEGSEYLFQSHFPNQWGISFKHSFRIWTLNCNKMPELF